MASAVAADLTFDEPLEHARELVMAHGWNATAYQIVNPSIVLWFSRTGDAVVGYVERGSTRVVAGSPVCSPERLAEVVTEFEQESAMRHCRVCYFGTEARLEGLLRSDHTHSMVLLGAQPSWNPSRWPAIVA